MVIHYIEHVYLMPYVYSFCPIFQALRLFPALRLFQTLEYVHFEPFRQKLHDLTDTMDSKSKASYPKMMGQGIAGRQPF